MAERDWAKIATRLLIEDLKLMISHANTIAVRHEVFVDEPTLILNLSCMCDEILDIIDKDGKGTI